MLTSKKIAYLKALSHHKKPIVTIGNKGLTESVLNEIHVGLKAHELIKIQVSGDDRQARSKLLQEICKASGAEPINHIGKLLVIYQQSDKKLIDLPD